MVWAGSFANHWKTYHSRIYHAADVISRNKNIELVNLNSFGCGLDAIVTDQTEEILKKNNKLYYLYVKSKKIQ